MALAIPESAPSYLAALLAAHPELAAINQDALSGSAKPIPPTIVADKGKFIIKKDGQETVVTFPDEERYRTAGVVGQPVAKLTAVILKGKPGKEKAWYATQYTPGQETTSPDCYSEDGVRPDASSRNKQCENCASCVQNAFGSGKKQDGTPSDGKACSDRKVIAIYAAGSVYRFAVPPASLSGKRPSGLGMAWDPYCNQLSVKGLPLPTVITEISFDQGDTDYKLNFNFGGMLAEKQLEGIVKILDTPEVADIVLPRGAGAPATNQIAAPQETKAIENNVADLDAARVAKEAADKKIADEAAAADKKKKDAAAAAKKKKDEAAAALNTGGADLLGLGGEPEVKVEAGASAGPSDDDLINSLGL